MYVQYSDSPASLTSGTIQYTVIYQHHLPDRPEIPFFRLLLTNRLTVKSPSSVLSPVNLPVSFSPFLFTRKFTGYPPMKPFSEIDLHQRISKKISFLLGEIVSKTLFTWAILLWPLPNFGHRPIFNRVKSPTFWPFSQTFQYPSWVFKQRSRLTPHSAFFCEGSGTDKQCMDSHISMLDEKPEHLHPSMFGHTQQRAQRERHHFG